MTVTKEYEAFLIRACAAAALAEGACPGTRLSRARLIEAVKADATILWSARPIRERIEIRRAVAALVLSKAAYSVTSSSSGSGGVLAASTVSDRR